MSILTHSVPGDTQIFNNEILTRLVPKTENSSRSGKFSVETLSKICVMKFYMFVVFNYP